MQCARHAGNDRRRSNWPPAHPLRTRVTYIAFREVGASQKISFVLNGRERMRSVLRHAGHFVQPAAPSAEPLLSAHLLSRLVAHDDEAFDNLVEWHPRFTDPQLNHFLFHSKRYGFDGNAGRLRGQRRSTRSISKKPTASMKAGWLPCRKAAGMWRRLHDLRWPYREWLSQTDNRFRIGW
jgi:hypothetical protein